MLAGMWFYAKNGEQHGPVEADEIRNRLSRGEIANTTLVWKEGMSQWTALGEVLELREPVPGGIAQASATAASASAPGATPITQMAQPAPNLVTPVQQNTMALVSMILGIVSIALCMMALTGIPAVICGHIARKQFRNSPHPQTGQGMALTGLILGYIAIVLSLAFIAMMVATSWVAASEAANAVPVTTPAPAPTPVP